MMYSTNWKLFSSRAASTVPAALASASANGDGVRTGAGAPPWGKTCGRCGTAFDADAWRELRDMGTLERTEIQAHLVVPAPDRIELRTCPRCGAVIAAKPPR